jgi:hypothetical protein
MTRFLLAAFTLVLLAACSESGGMDASTSDDAPNAAGACGDLVCGESQYCVATCLCCGVPGGTPAEQHECRTFTRSCDTSNMCACPEIATLGGICDPEHRRVEIPCT